MNIKEYIDQNTENAVYPGRGEFNGLLYCVDGLCGEIGKGFNILSKCMSEDQWELTLNKVSDFSSLFSNISWYLSQIIYEVMAANVDVKTETDLEYFFSECIKEETYVHGVIALHIGLSAMYLESAELLSKTNKFMYAAEDVDPENMEDRSIFVGEYMQSVIQHIAALLVCFGRCAVYLNVDVYDIINQNLKLLGERKSAGTLNGSGDGVKDRTTK